MSFNDKHERDLTTLAPELTLEVADVSRHVFLLSCRLLQHAEMSACVLNSAIYQSTSLLIAHWVKWQMGQTLTKLVQSLKNVVHPILPHPPSSLPASNDLSWQTKCSNILLAPAAFFLKVKSLTIQTLAMPVFAVEMLPGCVLRLRKSTPLLSFSVSLSALHVIWKCGNGERPYT